MSKLQINLEIEQYKSISELPQKFQKAVEAAKLAVNNAYAPYSTFRVGAAVLLENGEIITGTNQENSAYPSGICAERTALSYANHIYPNVPVELLVVSAFYNGEFVKTPTPPCGGCRQVMIETENRFKKPYNVILYGSETIYLINKASDLMPLSFNSDNLK